VTKPPHGILPSRTRPQKGVHAAKTAGVISPPRVGVPLMQLGTQEGVCVAQTPDVVSPPFAWVPLVRLGSRKRCTQRGRRRWSRPDTSITATQKKGSAKRYVRNSGTGVDGKAKEDQDN